VTYGLHKYKEQFQGSTIWVKSTKKKDYMGEAHTAKVGVAEKEYLLIN
jgi:hypothetical protein